MLLAVNDTYRLEEDDTRRNSKALHEMDTGGIQLLMIRQKNPSSIQRWALALSRGLEDVFDL